MGVDQLVTGGDVDNPVFQSVSTEQANIGPLKVGVLGDIHWRAGSRQPPDVPSTATTKADLDVFIDDMNSWGADVVVQMGDLADGMNVTFTELKTALSDAIDYLENSGGGGGNGLDAPVEHVIGNHEYAFAGSQNMTEIYNLFGWSTLDDTYRVVEYQGANLIILNTGYGTKDRTVDKNDHIIPAQELTWMRNNLPSLDREAYMFHHVPLSEGQKNNGYDEVGNATEASKILRDSKAYSTGFFGHVHHAADRGWDRIREQADDYGNHYLHLPDIHDLDGDATTKPYLKQYIHPGTGNWEAEASYGEQDTAFETAWRGAGDGRRADPGIKMFRNRTQPYRFSFPEDETGLDKSVTGSGGVIAVRTAGKERIKTGTTNGSTGQAILKKEIKLLPTHWEWQTQTLAFQTRIEFNSGLMSNQTLKMFYGGIADTDEHFGFRVDGDTLKASVGDGNTENQSTVKSGLGSGDIISLAALYNPHEGAAYFYVGDLELARLTSNLPGSGYRQINKLCNLHAANSAAEGKAFSIATWDVFQAGEYVTFDLLR